MKKAICDRKDSIPVNIIKPKDQKKKKEKEQFQNIQLAE